MSKKTRMSHTACDHENTKVARARCRRETARALELPKPAGAAEQMNDTARVWAVACTVCGNEFETNEKPDMEIDPVCDTCRASLPTVEDFDDLPEAPAAEPEWDDADAARSVTRENWRDFKTLSVSIELTADEAIMGTVTGWSEKNFQYRDVTGKTKRVPVAEVVRVTCYS